MEMQINVNTKIIYMDSAVPVMRAIENVKRDIRKVCCDSDEKGCDIVLIMENMQAEQFEIKCDNNMLVIYASDTLGFVYGLYHISRDILGVLPFWFWNDQVFIKKKGCRISGEYAYTSKPYAVKYRGWFVNDEVLIHKWYVDRKKDMPWEMVFEALLRCGGNLVIPGTDKNSHIYRDLAADMGLRITHHHAEPLGAPMFARRYPELTPSYDEYPEKFHELWKEGIDEQKKLDVIWNLGFRGQGDCPFWDNDPRYQTSESRGELMGKLIGLQRDYVQNEIPDAQYCTNLYGETMELYRDGYLKLPDDVIKIWADNGFGKMVTRRQGNHNPRIPALPKENNTGRHGIYYHVSFYDLQAANHITMLPNKPKLVHSELKKVLEHHVKDYWIINCSNVKPHVYYLDFIANMWRDGDVDIDKHLKGYIASYYGEDHITEIAECFRQYWQHALKYGEHEDDHAGEQFANHVARMLISQFMKDKSQRAEDLLWACDDKTLEGQVEWYKKLCARTMLETVDTLIHENYEKQLLLKDTKYKMLRAQINPHFLYNTLNVIHWMIRAKRNEEAGRMIVELGDILHYSFSQTPYAIISDEIKMVKSYIKIQQSRYQDRIKFEIFTEGALDKYIMPRMILQPLVENAISYGAEVSLDICTITVSVRENADAIVMEVIDDGVGMSEEELEAVRSYTFKPKGHGIGLKNISERLKMDDENSIFYIDSVSGKGTNVTIKLHKRAKGDQDV